MEADDGAGAGDGADGSDASAAAGIGFAVFPGSHLSCVERELAASPVRRPWQTKSYESVGPVKESGNNRDEWMCCCQFGRVLLPFRINFAALKRFKRYN